LPDQETVEPAHGTEDRLRFKKCATCGKEFKDNYALNRHRQTHGEVTEGGPKKQDKAPRPRVAPPLPAGAIEAQVMSAHVLVAMAFQMAGLVRTAQTVLQQGPMAAKAWAQWAEQNDFVRNTLEKGTLVTGAVAVAAAELPIAFVALAEIRERRFGPAPEAVAPEAGPDTSEVYPGTGDVSPNGFAYVAPTGTDGQGSTY
jgi:hypothetical protein